MIDEATTAFVVVGLVAYRKLGQCRHVPAKSRERKIGGQNDIFDHAAFYR
jgi:hypothetical protein